MAITRRAFLAWAAGAFPAAALVTRAHDAAVAGLAPGHVPDETLRALGDVVLPSVLGHDGKAKAVAAFVAWVKGYREHAELTHGYGTSRIRYSGPTPATRWTAQLDALESAAREQFRAGFASLSATRRELLVRDALAALRLDRMPDVADADHVVVGLLAHFYGSSDATDLCYRAAIGRERCRPLGHSARHPLPAASF